jgi:hypothetical protein
MWLKLRGVAPEFSLMAAFNCGAQGFRLYGYQCCGGNAR